MLRHLPPPTRGVAIFLAFAILATPVFGQTYVAGSLGFTDHSGDFTLGGEEFAVAGDGTVIGVELGIEPGSNGFGFSVGYGRDLSGDNEASALGAGLKYVPGDGGTWIELSMDRSSSDVGDITSFDGGIFRGLGDSGIVPYIGAGLGHSTVSLDGCDEESVMEGEVAAGIKNNLSDLIELEVELSYSISQSSDLTCTVGQSMVVAEDIQQKVLGAFLTVKRRF